MILPVRDYRRTHLNLPPPVHTGADAYVHGLVGLYRRKPGTTAGLRRVANRVLDRAAALRRVSTEEFARILSDLRAVFRRQAKQADHLDIEAMAVTVVTAERVLGLTPHPCQVMGALGMQKGFLIEMATGEGKTLTAALAAPAAAWSGRPCHIVTVNDYLSSRDAAGLKAFYEACGVTVGCVTEETEDEERRERYLQGIVYTTSQQLLADFLRDRLKMGVLQHPSIRLIRRMMDRRSADRDGLVMRGVDFALIDEADSVLIDEAVTPLIISRESENRPLIEASLNAVKIASKLIEGKHYTLETKYREIRLTDEGQTFISEYSHDMGGIFKGSPRRAELVTQALVARELYERDRQYVVQDDKIVIVDDFTGRLMPDRRWSHGLHQAVEAKEGLAGTSPTETMARLSFQRFFRVFRRLCGMSGTVWEAGSELWHIYELPIVSIPTHQPCRRKELPDAVFPDEASKRDAIVHEVQEVHRTGRPLLVGTRSVRDSEEIAARLRKSGLEVDVINAIRHEEEAAVIATAGHRGKITIATNMAGRGTDIHMGPGVRELGGLHVIATERNESRRIDRQLFGRAARQGDPGSAKAYVCPDDELMQRFISPALRDALRAMIRAGIPGHALMASITMSQAQRIAQSYAYAMRKVVLHSDEWLEDALSFTRRPSGI